MKIVFFGTSEFGAIILEKLVRAKLSPVLVVTTPDKPAGRKQVLTPPPAKVVAQRLGIPVIQPATLAISNFEFLISKQFQNSNDQNIKPDLFIVASYGKILPKEVLDIPERGTLNVHPSLLPRYRGSSPVQNTILNGDKETGVTIILLDEKMDHGPIVANAKFQTRALNKLSARPSTNEVSALVPNDKFTYLELHNKLAEVGAELLIRTIPDWIGGNIKPVPQDEGKATYTSILKKEDGRIDWNKEALYIERQVRALQPWPGTYTKFEIRSTKSETNSKSQILKIFTVEVIKNVQGQPGKTLLAQEGKLGVYAGKDALLIEELQLEGRKSMGSQEFLLGHKDLLGTVLE